MLDVLTNSKSKRAFGVRPLVCNIDTCVSLVSLCKWLPLRIQLGNKVGISKRRQNDNEEGELKRYDDGDKESKHTRCFAKFVERK